MSKATDWPTCTGAFRRVVTVIGVRFSVAKRLRKSIPWVRAEIRRGDLRALRIGVDLRIEVEELLTYYRTNAYTGPDQRRQRRDARREVIVPRRRRRHLPEKL